MTDTTGDTPIHEQGGFDYTQAMRDLLERFTYSEVAVKLGYRSVGSVTSILKGMAPSHLHGQALWMLYRSTFNRRPPLTTAQKIANSLTD